MIPFRARDEVNHVFFAPTTKLLVISNEALGSNLDNCFRILLPPAATGSQLAPSVPHTPIRTCNGINSSGFKSEKYYVHVNTDLGILNLDDDGEVREDSHEPAVDGEVEDGLGGP